MLAAKLEVRQKRLDSARKILGMALGMAPKDKTFKAYIELEMQLGNIDRCVCGAGWGGGAVAACSTSARPTRASVRACLAGVFLDVGLKPP